MIRVTVTTSQPGYLGNNLMSSTSPDQGLWGKVAFSYQGVKGSMTSSGSSGIMVCGWVDIFWKDTFYTLMSTDPFPGVCSGMDRTR